jgi:hypothetical protein
MVGISVTLGTNRDGAYQPDAPDRLWEGKRTDTTCPALPYLPAYQSPTQRYSVPDLLYQGSRSREREWAVIYRRPPRQLQGMCGGGGGGGPPAPILLCWADPRGVFTKKNRPPHPHVRGVLLYFLLIYLL